jgi:hypothetical protein
VNRAGTECKLFQRSLGDWLTNRRTRQPPADDRHRPE